MNIVTSEMKTMLLIKFLEKELALNYLIIIIKVFKTVFELSNVNIKLEVLNNKHSR